MRKLIQGTALLAVIVLVVACEEAAAPPSSYEPPPENIEQPSDPEAPLPVVSFAGTPAGPGRVRTEIWDTVDTIIMTISLAPPPTNPVEINLFPDWPEYYSHPQTVTAQAGSSEVSFTVTIHKWVSPDLLLLPGPGYIVGNVDTHEFQIFATPEPNVQDPRCSYPTKWLLLDMVSSAGIMCATGISTISQDALDKVSRASSMMLRHRPDLATILVDDEMDSSLPMAEQQGQVETDFILLYRGGNYWCDGLPISYQDSSLCGPQIAVGKYDAGVVVCPDNDLAVCVHELAHAVYWSLCCWPVDVDQREPVTERFNQPEVAELWSGYAMTNHREFFAEMSTIYFCVPGGSLTLPVKHCASELREYDPATYDVIHAIYRGSTDLR